MTMGREIRADCGGEAGAADDADREGGAGGDQEQPIARGQGHEEHPGRVQGDRQGRLGRLVRVCFRIRLHVVAEMDDGVLCVVRDYDEFKMAMDRLGLGLTATQCEQCIEVLDTDGDGEVSLSEFLVQSLSAPDCLRIGIFDGYLGRCWWRSLQRRPPRRSGTNSPTISNNLIRF